MKDFETLSTNIGAYQNQYDLLHSEATFYMAFYLVYPKILQLIFIHVGTLYI